LSKVSDMVEEHFSPRGPIVILYKDVNEESGKVTEIYMIKSITRKNHSYNVVFENGKWYCDCPAFKFRKGVDKEGHCKHCLLVIFLLDQKVVINEI